MKIAIFGIGLIGSAIVNELDEDRHSITLFDIVKLKVNDKIMFYQTNYKDLSAIPWEEYDLIIITIGINNENKRLMKYVNCELCENIIRSIKVNTKLIFFSSSAIYSNTEEIKVESDLLNPETYYGMTKLYIENLIKTQLENYIIVRPFNVYGDYRYSHCNVEVVKRDSIVDEMVKKNQIKFLKTNNDFVVRDFVSTKFIGEVIAKLVDGNLNKEVVNICSGFGFEYEKYYNLIPNEEVINNNSLPRVLIGSTKKLEKLIGFEKISKQADYIKEILNS